MLVSKEWICEYIDIDDIPAKDLEKLFNNLGFEVESYQEKKTP